MTVIYFTDGALIEDESIRRSLLRIPEVIECLKKAEKEFVNCDLFMVMNEQSCYLALNYHQKQHLKYTVQQGLFKRWIKSEIEPDLIIRRTEYSDFTVLTDLFKKLSTIDSLNVVTIGPGFDELEIFLRVQLKLPVNPVHEVISQDPMLNWFWKDVRSSLQLHS